MRHIQTGSFPYSSDGKYWLSIMMHRLPTQSLSKYYDLSNIFPFTAVYSQYNQRNDIFTRGENISSNHEEPVRSTGFSMRETLCLFIKSFREKRPNSMLTTKAPFYLSMSYSKDSGRCWFKASAMGANKAGLDERRQLTNHSTRKTPLQQ